MRDNLPIMTRHEPASPAHAQLERFVGSWTTSGDIKDPDAAESTPFTARDTYQWMPGGHFLLHHFDADMPAGRIRGIEIIGFDPATGTYPAFSFDSTGETSVLHARLEDESWIFEGEGVRFTGVFDAEGTTLGGTWERRSASDGRWNPWMSVTLHREA